jgi:hypothetical protein
MHDPWQKFKLQPWKPLFQVACLTVLIASTIDFILIQLFINSRIWYVFFETTGLIISLAAGFGLGSLGVYICKKWKPEVVLNASSLWALVLCLIIGLLLRSLIPIIALLISFSQFFIMALIVGVFWTGRFHWRYWR